MDTLDTTGRLTRRESRDLNDQNLIDESIWGITYNDDNEPVTLSIWFKGDKRDGVLEVFWKCDAPPSDIDNHDALYDLIWEQTGLTRNYFTRAQFIRVHDEKVEKELAEVLPKLTVEDLDDLQLILSMAQVMLESLDEQRSKPSSSAINRWSSRAMHAKSRKQVKVA